MLTGQEIKELRNNVNISQQVLAYRTGVSQFRLSQYERGLKSLSLGEVEQIQAFLFREVESLHKQRMELKKRSQK